MPTALPDQRSRRILRLFAAATVVALVATSQATFGVHRDEPGQAWLREAALQFPFWYGWAALVPLVRRVTRRLASDRVTMVLKLVLHIAAGAGFSVFHSLATMTLQHLAGLYRSVPITAGMYAHDALLQLSTNLLAYGAIVGLVYTGDVRRRLQEREIASAQLGEQLADARLRALRMQLNPHFLFNALNTIAMQVRQSANAEAVRMLAGLSDLMRYLLDDSRPAEVPLADELEFVRRYLAIEQVRFQDRLRVEIQAGPETTPALVPTLVLQPIVENAIRHGISRRAGAGQLVIRARKEGGMLVLQVEDDGPGFDAAVTPVPGTGLGLDNTRARLEQSYQGGAGIELGTSPAGGAMVTLRLPFRESTARASR